jgi:hypothetical protein
VPRVEVADGQVHVVVLFVHCHIRTPDLTIWSADRAFLRYPPNYAQEGFAQVGFGRVRVALLGG